MQAEVPDVSSVEGLGQAEDGEGPGGGENITDEDMSGLYSRISAMRELDVEVRGVVLLLLFMVVGGEGNSKWRMPGLDTTIDTTIVLYCTVRECEMRRVYVR